MNHKIKYISAAILLAISTMATAKNNLKDDYYAHIGDAYSSDQQLFIGQSCLNTDKYIFSGKSSTLINMGDIKNFDELEHDLSVSTSSKLSIGMFKAGFNADYVNNIKTDNRSEAFYFIEKIALPAKIFQPAAYAANSLNDYGKTEYTKDIDPDHPNIHPDFTNACGDEFVQKQTLGAELLVTLKIKFNSLIAKQQFDLNASAGIGSIFDAKSSIQQLINKQAIDGNLEIHVIQLGGTPTKLTDIFTKSKEGDYYFASCPLNAAGFANCSNVIDGVIKYAQTELPTQVGFTSGAPTGNPTVLSNTMAPYTRLGLDNSESDLTADIIKARAELADEYQTTISQSNFIKALQASPITGGHLTGDAQTALTNINNAVNANLNLFANDSTESGPQACYINPGKCVEIASTIKSQMQSVDTTTLNKFKVAYKDITPGPDNHFTTDYYYLPVGLDSGYVMSTINYNVTFANPLTSIVQTGNSLALNGLDATMVIGDPVKMLNTYTDSYVTPKDTVESFDPMLQGDDVYAAPSNGATNRASAELLMKVETPV